MRKRVHRFWLQPTPSFEHGPQREMFLTDEDLLEAEALYAKEWRASYHCYGCSEPACPQCRQVGTILELGSLDMTLNIRDTARFSPDVGPDDDERTGLYRYTLSRALGPQDRVLMSCGLNPSTATAFKPDNTIRRDVIFARGWRCGALWKFNAYAYRTKSPAVMKGARKSGVDIVGPENDRWIRWGCALVRETDGILWVSWGANVDPDRQRQLAALFAKEKVEPLCWSTNDDGSPEHELYSPREVTLKPWRCP